MENTTNTHAETQTLSRRELLKALGAAGGALATTAFLPGSWSKPAVEAGALPAHALATAVLEITQLDVCSFNPDLSVESKILYDYRVRIEFHDDAGMVNKDARIFAWDGCGPLPFNGSAIVDLPNLLFTGDSEDGALSFDFDWQPCGELCVRLAVGPRWSNTECASPHFCG